MSALLAVPLRSVGTERLFAQAVVALLHRHGFMPQCREWVATQAMDLKTKTRIGRTLSEITMMQGSTMAIMHVLAEQLDHLRQCLSLVPPIHNPIPPCFAD